MSHLSKTSFATIEAKIAGLEGLLAEHGVTPVDESALAGMLRGAKQVIANWRNPSSEVDFDTHAAMTDFAELSYLCDVLASHGIGTFAERLIPRLKLLALGDPGPLAPAKQSTARDLTFETVCAAACSRFSSDVAFEEPDVRCIAEGARWGLACKAAYKTDQGGENAIRRALKQVRDSDVDYGIVVVQMTNVFNHNGMYLRDPKTGDITAFRHRAALEALFEQRLKECCAPFIRGAKRAAERGRDARACGVLFVCQTAAYFREMRVILTNSCYHPYSPLVGPDEAFVGKLNSYLQEPLKDKTLVVPHL